MTKKLIAIFFAIFICLFISNKLTTFVQGQTQVQGPSPQLWRCLQVQQVGKQTRRPPPELDLKLTGGGFAELQDIYVVLCTPSIGANYKCTTGNGDYDRLLFGSDLRSTLSPLTFEVPKGSIPPQTIQSVGDKVDTVLHLSHADGHVDYIFFGVNVSDTQLLPGQGSTIQYGTFLTQQEPAGCKSIRWDPYGRVFDSQSLEPISNVTVNLLDTNKQFAVLKGLVNPDRTEADGVYNFFVDIPGTDPVTFYLKPVPPNLPPDNLPHHIFTAAPNLNPNYSKAYYDIYMPDDPVIEAPGRPEHRDIPLDPGLNPPFRSTPVDMSAASIRLGNWTRFEGVVSHPLTIIKLVAKISQKEIAQTTADKEGFWQIVVSNEQIPHNEPLTVEKEKVDLTTLSRKSPRNSFSKNIYQFFQWLIKNVLSFINRETLAQVTNAKAVEFQPILSYVEGYAKDQTGNVLPNATVKVKLEMSNGIYYQTTADENGFFTIPPQNLPIFTYNLEFTPVDRAILVKTTTAEFAQQNEEYLTTNKVNLMVGTKNGESLLPTTKPSEASQTVITPTTTASNNSLFAGNNANMILTLIALVVLLAVAGGVLIYIRKKKTETDNLL